MNYHKMNKGVLKALFFSYKSQFENNEPMTSKEVSQMWKMQGALWQKGFSFGWLKIKEEKRTKKID